jgi:hypothetical protein
MHGILATIRALQIGCLEFTAQLIMFILGVYICSQAIGLALFMDGIVTITPTTSGSREKTIERGFMYGVIGIPSVGDSGGGMITLAAKNLTKLTPVTATIRITRKP